MNFKAIARQVACEVLGTNTKLHEEAGGLRNEVFSVEHAGAAYVIRLSSRPHAIRTFRKEQWAIHRVKRARIPAPKLINVGELDRVAFMVSEKVAGEDATNCVDRMKVVRQMGRLAARINKIPTDGLGNVFDWAPPRVKRIRSWQKYLRDEVGIEHRLDMLLEHDMINYSMADDLRSSLENLEVTDESARLLHGDLRLKNVIVDENDKVVALLDWEHALSNPAPYWEFSIALHDLTVDEKTEFIRGYGLSEEEFIEVAPAARALNILNYAPHVEKAAKRADEKKLRSYRLRLSGALDLY
jgi:aminoglycoside phosphotransferase (APT) family kinase protein